ncbi:calcium-binding protein [Geminocystis sp. CENA526]|uniref:calcium-binding protein n=1 Tax=Geminocystis sp. CENA526 TaxID=1355871 RepID=UPI003D6E6D70
MALIVGTNRTALLPGLFYTEKLIGTNFDDIIYGLRGDDLIEGGNGNDSLYGGQPNATYTNDGNDTLIGGAGNDYLDGGDGNDSLDGGSGDDRLFGRGGRDYLFGGTGHDYLDGGGGRDTLIGGDGSDILVGGGGRDTLAGGNGGVNGDAFIDWFVWRNTNHIGDTVLDFTKGLDKIVLNGNANNFDLTRNNTNRINPARPLSFNLAVQSNLFTSNRRFYRLHDSDYEQVTATTVVDLNAQLITATAKIVAVIPNGNDPNVPEASLFYDPNPSNTTNNYELIANFTNGVTPTQTNTNIFDILVY